MISSSTLSSGTNETAFLIAHQAIEGFRNLNAELETIINRSEQIKDAKRRQGEGEELSQKEKKELTEAEKERKGAIRLAGVAWQRVLFHNESRLARRASGEDRNTPGAARRCDL